MSDLFKYGWKVVQSTAPLNIDLFYDSMEHNYFEIAQHIYASVEFNYFYWDRALRCASKSNNLKMVQWVIEILSLSLPYAFARLCYYGNLQIAKQLWTISEQQGTTIDISQNDECVFREACLGGHLDVAQWLLSIKPDIDVSAWGESAFSNACSNGHLEVAQWLMSIKPSIDVSAENENAFRKACLGGHLEVARWLCFTYYVSISAENDLAFRGACSNGHLDVAQWLCNVGEYIDFKIDVEACDDMAFRHSCVNNHLNVAQWLCSLFPNKYVITHADDKRIEYYINNIDIIGTQTFDDNECTICFERTCDLMVSSCKHFFCRICILKWMTNHDSCPTCRSTVDSFIESAT